MSSSSKTQQNYLKSIHARSGVYIITQYHPGKVPNKKIDVKIGLAEDLHGRFGNYLLCFPQGFYVFQLFLTVDVKQAYRLERSLHQYLVAKYKFLTKHHSHSEETFRLTPTEVEILIATVKANTGRVFVKGDDKVSGLDQEGLTIFPHLKYKKAIFLDENLAMGGTRIKSMKLSLKDFIDGNLKKKPILTSVTKKKHNSKKLPIKGKKIL
jgi:hypothetical protein